MTKLVTLTLTDDDCLNVRLALNATAMEWGDKASAHRASGAEFDARVCEEIRSEYHRLWEAVNVAQEAPEAPGAQEAVNAAQEAVNVAQEALNAAQEALNAAQEAVNMAQEAVNDGAAPPVHNGFHPPGYDPSTCEACNDKASVEARAAARAAAMRAPDTVAFDAAMARCEKLGMRFDDA
jgi:hypothetical protein